MKNPTDLVIVIGLAAGGIFGLLGTIVADQHLRAASWAIDGVGLVVATSLLTLKYFRRGNDCVAGGFLVFAIGEGVLISGAATTLEQGLPSFAAGTALWSAALLLTGVPKEFPTWARLLSVIGGVLFAFVAGRIFLGEKLLPIDSPLPFFAYPFLVFSFVGWILTVLRSPSSLNARK